MTVSPRPVSLAALRRAYEADGQTIKQLAVEYRASVSGTYKRLRAAGAEMRRAACRGCGEENWGRNGICTLRR